MTAKLATFTALFLACAVGYGVQRDTSPADIDVPSAAAVDSALPHREEMRRFLVGLEEHPTQLSGGTESLDSLARRLLTALASRDTAMLRSLAVSKAEFAYLVYPSDPHSKPPYDLPPQLMWMTSQAASSRGLTRALRKLGGAELEFKDIRCETGPEPRGENRVHDGCKIRLLTAGRVESVVLFGPVVERGGRFKILSFSNPL